MLLSSCSCSIFRATIKKTLSVYNLDAYDGNSLDSCKTVTVDARFNKNEPYVPYLSLKQYASLYSPHFADDVSSNVSKKGDFTTWTVSRGSDLYFITQIDFAKKEVVVAGSLEATYKTADDPRDTASLYYGNFTEYDSRMLGSSYYAHYNFADVEIDSFSYLGENYLPLSFYDITYSFDSSIYFYYNYDSIYSARELETFYSLKYKKSGKEYCVVTEMYHLKEDSTIPSYLLNLNSNLFLYLLDNFYGLKDYKEINNATSYCQSIGTYERLFDTDDSIRTQAYAETLDRLDDNHTALVAGSYVWGNQNYIARQYGKGCLKRSEIRGELTTIRKNTTSESYRNDDREILYSTDGKTAMLLFDQFTYGTRDQVFNNDGTIKDDAGNYDSYFALLDSFKKIAARGGVENVILDMSTNGGGVLGVLMKLLALISKNDMGNLYYLDASTNQLGIAKTQVDSNADGFYNADDCFGDDFNFYLLTSDCSYSCGNAFPFIAQKSETAKIIGQKSGGGECAVSIHYLPNGEYVYHSSNLHIGYFDYSSETFIGSESGASPDVLVVDRDEFYNVDALATYIANSEID